MLFRSGLWHGASWTFIIWGALHCLYYLSFMSINQFMVSRRGPSEDRRESRLLRIGKIVFTFLLVDFAWIFFRANSVNDALYVIKNMFSFGLSDLEKLFTSYFTGYGLYLLLVLFIFIIGKISLRGSIIERISKLPIYIRWAIYYIFIFTMIIFAVQVSGQFIYAQF